MGKAQKLKQLRKAEKLDSLEKNENMKKGMTRVFSIIVVIAVLIGGGFYIYGNSGSDSNNEGKIADENQDNSDSGTEKVKEVELVLDKDGNVQAMNPLYTYAIMHTNKGDIRLKLYLQAAPKTTDNFIKLAKQGFYNGVKFHRVIEDFMIQGGDPKSKDNNWSDDGTGGPGYMFEDEINDYKLTRGKLAMANSGPDTNGSQFFIVTAESTPWLDGKHTVFGEVVGGMEVVGKIESVSVNGNDHPLEDIVINGIDVEE